MWNTRTPRFHDRRDGGRKLAASLAALRGAKDVVVLALPRGGVPVAFEVAQALGAPLDILLVRKLGVPGHEELAMGALASGGIRVLNQPMIDSLGIPHSAVERVVAKERLELARRERVYRGELQPPLLAGRTVVLVDDGFATGSTMIAAVAAVRAQAPRRIITAAPVASSSAVESLRKVADNCVVPSVPSTFDGVGAWYDDFTQTTDAEVMELLETARREEFAPKQFA